MITPAMRAQMILDGTHTIWRVGNHAPSILARSSGVGLVLRGELVRHNRVDDPLFPDAPQRLEPVANTRTGDTFGELGRALQTPRSMGWAQAPRIPTEVVAVPEWNVASVLGVDPSGYAAFHAAHQTRQGWVTKAQGAKDSLDNVPQRPANVTLLVADWTNPELATVVDEIQAAVAALGEPNFHIYLHTGAPAALTGTGTLVTAGASPMGDLLTTIQNLPNFAAPLKRCFVLADAGVDVREIAEAVDRVVYLHRGANVLWPAMRPVRTPYACVALIDPAVGMATTGETPFPANTVRIEWQAGWPLVPPQIGEIVRAVTDRRVAVAFGGGGGLAYSHLAVLKALEAQQIPIDMTSGVSFGTVVACYWARYGNDAADQMISDRLLLQISAMAHSIAGVFAQRIMDGVLNSPMVESEPRVVFPMAADLITTSLEPITMGSAGYCIRASGGFAPIFPATPGNDRAHVDGGLLANVPAYILQLEGARLVLASEAIAPTKGTPLTPDLSSVSPEWLRDLCDLTLDLVDPRRRWIAGFRGAQSLFNGQGEMSAAGAQVHFEATEVSTIPYWLMDPWTVINATQGADFNASADLALHRWQEILKPIP